MTAMNLVKVDVDDYDVLCVQDPYVFADGRIGGIPDGAPTFYSRTQVRLMVLALNKTIPTMGGHSGERRCCSAV